MTATSCTPRPSPKSGRLPISMLVAVAALAASGCYGAYRGRVATTPVYYQQQQQYGYQTAYPAQAQLIYQAPPPPRQVYAPPQPYAGAQWVDGHWEWNGAQYVWMDGYWTEGRPGYVYMQPRWEQRGGGHIYVQGGWNQSGSTVVVQPQPYRQQPPPNYGGRGTVVVQPSGGRGSGTVVVQPSYGGGGGRGTVVVQPSAPSGRVVVQPSAPSAPSGRVVVQPSAPPAPSGRVVVQPSGGGGGRVVVQPSGPAGQAVRGSGRVLVR